MTQASDSTIYKSLTCNFEIKLPKGILLNRVNENYYLIGDVTVQRIPGCKTIKNLPNCQFMAIVPFNSNSNIQTENFYISVAKIKDKISADKASEIFNRHFQTGKHKVRIVNSRIFYRAYFNEGVASTIESDTSYIAIINHYIYKLTPQVFYFDDPDNVSSGEEVVGEVFDSLRIKNMLAEKSKIYPFLDNFKIIND
ncbi:MAG: hypothetical protein A3E87_07255 [Gammaproteobacteria bacterium RIFCSPHIGHO2_12_FULL_35_23]|nr:MAG: hypothetical protein A3E87_07255 [Gammaproteobacteria bacterium RIFCSPHIGHO2_12_FULL_35_23]